MKVAYIQEVERLTVGEMRELIKDLPNDTQIWVESEETVFARPVEKGSISEITIDEAGTEEKAVILVTK